ncbi:zinc ribbon domain-containing protein [Allorhodopirellula heiligendammensis]|uniref:Zinc ribbon domain protein n=1 Tax=Allorhodopirellula heiligendammensis TaxID=2714739 RepID=A0A5C6BW93_9BACT|nr:C4-type zinc ribbon domain-containing protein [Allorhodopirellula heiligendammensis]TWU15731.1 putative zinc ribbon domain protein [Allorhodopirellula heiligendammensis]
MASPKSTEISTPLLRRLHRIHQQRADLESQARRGPLQLKAVQASIDVATQAVDAEIAVLKKARMVSDEKHLQLQTREAHVSQLQRRLNEAATNKEFALLKEQIAADEQANSVQNDEIFEILERIDTLEAQLARTKEKLAEVEADAAKRRAEIEDRQKRVAIDLDRVEVQLEEAETLIPAAVKADYKRLLEARGEEALAPIENESCGGCYQTLTTQVANQVMLSQLTYCPNCNAMLYLPEDRSV